MKKTIFIILCLLLTSFFSTFASADEVDTGCIDLDFSLHSYEEYSEYFEKHLTRESFVNFSVFEPTGWKFMLFNFGNVTPYFNKQTVDCTTMDTYSYIVTDESGLSCSITIYESEHNKPNTSPITAEYVDTSDMRYLIQPADSDATLEYYTGNMSYRYHEGELRYITWQNDGIEYVLSIPYRNVEEWHDDQIEYKRVICYPENSDTFIGKLLYDADNAEATLSQLNYGDRSHIESYNKYRSTELLKDIALYGSICVCATAISIGVIFIIKHRMTRKSTK